MSVGTWFAQCDNCLKTRNLDTVPTTWRVNEDGLVVCGPCIRRGHKPKAGQWRKITRVPT